MAGTQTVQETGEQKKTGSHWMEIRVSHFVSPGYTLKCILKIQIHSCCQLEKIESKAQITTHFLLLPQV